MCHNVYLYKLYHRKRRKKSKRDKKEDLKDPLDPCYSSLGTNYISITWEVVRNGEF